MALGLPGAAEAPHFERTSFRVNGRIFATLTARGDEAMVRLRPPEAALALIAERPDVFFSYGGWTAKRGSVGVWLRKVPVRLLSALLSGSYEDAAREKSARRRPRSNAKPRISRTR